MKDTMMEPIPVLIAHRMVERCEKFGQQVVNGYAAGRKKHSKSLAMNGIASNVPVQSAGRMAEVAMCLYMGLDADTALNWKSKCDAGYDLRLPNGSTVDVKASTHPAARRLIWPASKVSFLHKAADILVFARVLPAQRNELGQIVHLVGWITKDRFIKQSTKAQNEYKISDGTVYIFESALDDMSVLSNNRSSI